MHANCGYHFPRAEFPFVISRILLRSPLFSGGASTSPDQNLIEFGVNTLNTVRLGCAASSKTNYLGVTVPIAIWHSCPERCKGCQQTTPSVDAKFRHKI